MTRLYVNVYCDACNRVVGADVGTYFGKKLWDKHKTIPECYMCRFKRLSYKAEKLGLNDEKVFNTGSLDELERKMLELERAKPGF